MLVKISYSILTHNETDSLEKLLKFLVKWKQPEDEIVILDDYSDDEKTKQILDLAYFNRKLEQYSAYEYWAEDNYNITRAVNYDDIHRDVDSMMKELTGLDHNVEDRFGISLQEYSTVRYMTSLYMQTKDKKYLCRKDQAAGTIQLKKFIQSLLSNKLPNEIPVKMNTMQDKQKRVLNFDDAVEVYNKWTTTTNSHMPISQENIAQTILTESKIYAT